MRQRPAHITLTGYDAPRDIEEMVALAAAPQGDAAESTHWAKELAAALANRAGRPLAQP